jgi:hypothetical protein
VAADQRLSDVVAFVRDLTRDEAEAARAAMAEPDDDVYLARRARLSAYHGERLSPVVDRFAVPGGHDDDADPPRAQGIHPRVVFAIVAGASGGRPAWHAYVSSLRSAEGASIDQELSIVEVDGRPLVVGRRATDPFVDDLAWEDDGGTPLDLDRVDDVTIEQLPADPQHTQFLRQLAGD